MPEKSSDLLSKIKSLIIDSSEKSNHKRLYLIKHDLSCLPACDGCCSRMVNLTIAEALVLIQYLSSKNKLQEVLNRCEEMLNISKLSNPISWFKMDLKCPVLDPEKKLCLAYQVRPSACSTHFVSSHKNQCQPWTTKSGDFVLERFDDIFDEFRDKLEKIIDGHGILAYSMPLPQALLFADKIIRIKWSDWEHMTKFIFQELS